MDACPISGKLACPSREAAERHRVHLRRSGMADDSRQPLCVYRCRCGRWHVGHSIGKRRLAGKR